MTKGMEDSGMSYRKKKHISASFKIDAYSLQASTPIAQILFPSAPRCTTYHRAA